jgi:hypothetical protein
VPSNENGFDTGRLRFSGWLIGIASLVLLVSLFALKWYGVRSQLAGTAAALQLPGLSRDGWNSSTITRYFVLATALLGLAAWFFQASRRAPALPVTLTAMLNPLGLITSLLVFHRVVISRPGANDLVSLRAGGIIGLISVITVTVAAYRWLREDGIREIDGPQEIETFRQRRRPVGAA